MTKLQNELIEVYNNLVVFSNEVLSSKLPRPIRVHYEPEYSVLVFSCAGKSVRMGIPVYYSLGLEDLTKPTWLLPQDYDYLMGTLSNLIAEGVFTNEHVCISPENYGFDVYLTNSEEHWKGPELIGTVRFISGKSRWFKWKVGFKYKIKL